MRTNLNEIKPKDEKYYGVYRGVVEDNSDPDKMGRCKVRVFGIHDESKTESKGYGIPTSKLPWAEPALGLFEGAVSGFGAWTVPLQGSHVFVFFENNNKHNIRFFASAPGKPTEASDSSKGFNDPDGVYPIEESDAPHKPNQLDESDYHRLARGNAADTIVENKNSNRDTSINIANGGTWNEPKSYYNTKYPHNKVFSTHSGITIEIDDTDGEERIHVYHPSGSYVEINKDGNMIIRNAADRFEIIDNNLKKHVVNDYDRTVDNNRTSKVGNDQSEQIGNNKTITVGGTTDETSSSTHTIIASTIHLNP